jgi:hypothetical protein
MATLLGFRISSFINYVISISDIRSEAEVNALALVMGFSILIIIATSQANIYMQSRLKTDSIFAEDDVDRHLN